jgi:hypothetical protein
MSCYLDDQSGLLDQDWTATTPFGSLRLNGLRVLVKIGAQKLPQVRMDSSLPSNGKNFSSGRNVFLHGYACRRLDFMNCIGTGAGCSQASLHFHLVLLHR